VINRIGWALCRLGQHRFEVVHREPYMGHPTMTRVIWRCARPGCFAQVIEPDDLFKRGR